MSRAAGGSAPEVIDLGSSDDEQENAAVGRNHVAGAKAAAAPPRKASASGKAAAQAIDLCGEDDDGNADAGGLVIDLSDNAEGAAGADDVIDLTADDSSLAKQMQRAFNAAIDLTQNDGTESDILHAYRQGIDRFLNERGAQYGFSVREIVHNAHSRPGTRLYDRFYAAFKKCKEKQIQLVFHGTSEDNIAAILEKSLDPSKRGANGQALGAGEYFAEDPLISLPYCKGGRKMLIFAVIMDQSGLRKHNTHGILVCHRPAHHLPLAVVTLDRSTSDILARLGSQGYVPGMPSLAGLSIPSLAGIARMMSAGLPMPSFARLPPAARPPPPQRQPQARPAPSRKRHRSHR